jgi:peptide/nickel transport system permease protein
MTDATIARRWSWRRRRTRLRIVGDWGGRIGVFLLLVTLFVGIAGPWLAPHSPNTPIGIPGAAPFQGAPLGLDYLGRDVLSRLLWGGRSTLLLAGAATALTYAMGLAVGLVAGYSRSIVDPILMRTVDVTLSIPALLVMLLGVTAFGGSPVVLVVAASLVLFPGVARIVRTATMEVAARSYVEAAVARGEKTTSILRREILPNILGPVVADLGVRFSWSIILIASVNYLGLGLKPPAADWGLMVSENRVILSSNALAVLAPALTLAILIVGVNLTADAYLRQRVRRGGAS